MEVLTQQTDRPAQTAALAREEKAAKQSKKNQKKPQQTSVNLRLRPRQAKMLEGIAKLKSQKGAALTAGYAPSMAESAFRILAGTTSNPLSSNGQVPMKEFAYNGFLNRQMGLSANGNTRCFMHLTKHHQFPGADAEIEMEISARKEKAAPKQSKKSKKKRQQKAVNLKLTPRQAKLLEGIRQPQESKSRPHSPRATRR